MRALLLAAGLGTRLFPITKSVPKCLIPIQGKSMLKRWINTLNIPNITEIVVNTHHHRQKVLSEIKTIESKVNIVEVNEKSLLGTAGTLIMNISNLDNDLLVVHCDNFSSINIGEFLDFHRSGKNFMSMAIFKPKDKSKCGMVEISESGHIIQFIEKPHDSDLEWANAAVYVFSKECLDEIKSNCKLAKDISLDLIPNFLGRMSSYKIDGYHIDIGTHESLAETVLRFQ